MKKVKKNSWKNTNKCVICGCSTKEVGLRSPFNTAVCLDCCLTIHQVVEHAAKNGTERNLFMRMHNSNDKQGFTPLIPLFTE